MTGLQFSTLVPLMGMLCIAAGIDWRQRRIPNWLTVLMLISGIATSFLAGHVAAPTQALLGLLERRLDNVVCRLGLASTRRQARQFVVHGHVEVDGRRLDIPSALVADGSQVRIKAGAPVAALAHEASEGIAVLPAWLEVDHEALAGRVLRAPQREEIAMPVTEQLVIERYARR